MMLTPLPVSRVAHEWERIVEALRPAVERDPKFSLWDLMHDAITGNCTVWRPQKPADGYLVTQVSDGPPKGKRLLWLIYAGGIGGGFKTMRRLLRDLEIYAASERCSELWFEGRDWRRICPDYSAELGADGRWKFKKVL